MAVSFNGELACTISDDKIVKVFDVVNFGKNVVIWLKSNQECVLRSVQE